MLGSAAGAGVAAGEAFRMIVVVVAALLPRLSGFTEGGRVDPGTTLT
jgi:hypothetical protein